MINIGIYGATGSWVPFEAIWLSFILAYIYIGVLISKRTTPN